ncbi:type I polyketide synthase [Polyangium aurulentum]|uniref:type I polyketide synthase n=1 Tax=Polyangium aurulentum TaxID=2567896 RepID=UPI00200BC51C|nr:type I polyketide synthase [Polyangium aurulentum]UQA61057.1 type I polyketide synthase [Polyangium aurulentum]
MSASIEEYRSRLRAALAQIQEMEAELEAVAEERSEPIAVIGMACRFPGDASTPEAFYRSLIEGRDSVGEVPPERWPLPPIEAGMASPEARATRWGSFLKDVDLFDAAFFGISPREAASMDPQQRLLLEVTWEALENAGLVPERLSGSRTGVFVGLTANDYFALRTQRGVESMEIYDATGNGHCFPAGRISYTLGFQGPCVAVDTACSSSLVAIHLACQSLRLHESDLGLAGGVNLMLSPTAMSVLAKTHALSPDGRCKAFDAQANGFVRGEGCGVVLLKRLSDAQRDRDPILALILGSALNQDGRSAGFAAPNLLAQEAVLREALERARITAEDIGYLETHGTGTPLGDPIEAGALGAVLGKARPDGSPCVLGALKTNVGHLEAAAGVAGLIKAVLVLQQGTVPKNLHFRALNPRISFEGTPFVIPTENTPFPRSARPRRAGVSSFGMSGTNAHVIVEEAPVVERAPSQEASAYLLPLSAKSHEALISMARAHAERLDAPEDLSLHDFAYTACVRRMHHEHRLAVVGRTRHELAQSLQAFSRGDKPAGVVTGRLPPQGRPKLVFVFPGQGSQWLGMGRQLLREQPAFRSALLVCDVAIQRESGFSVLHELTAEESSSRLGEIDVVQPVLFALEVALASLWRSWGIIPDCVVGHSMGEVAAAHVAGMLHLDDAAKIICRRSRLLRRISGKGAMALVELDMADASRAIEGHADTLDIAVSNGPRSTVLAGQPAALEQVLATLEQRGVFCRRVKVDVASHSPQVDPLLQELLSTLADIRPSQGLLPMLSTVTAAPLRGTELDPAYWAANLRKPVRFSHVTQSLVSDGFLSFLEISPHPILLPAIEENLRHASVSGHAIASLRRDNDELRCMLDALASLYSTGHQVDWDTLFPHGGRCLPLPAYPWQRQRHWMAPLPQPTSTRGHRSKPGDHPLLGSSFKVAALPGTRLWENALDATSLSWLADHRVRADVVFPGTGYVEMALAAAASRGAAEVELRDFSFERMMVIPRGEERVVQALLADEGSTGASFQVSSLDPAGEAWTRHASASVHDAPSSGQAQTTVETIRVLRERCPEPVSIDDLYTQMEQRGISYGARFRGVREIWLGPGEVLGRVRLPDDESSAAGYRVHPALLDACLQLLAALPLLTERTPEQPPTYVPTAIERLRMHRVPGREVWARARIRGENTSAEAAAFDVLVMDEHNQVIIEIEGLRVARLAENATAGTDGLDACIHVVQWRPMPLAVGALAMQAEGLWLIVEDQGGVGASLADSIASLGGACVRAIPGERYAHLGPRSYQVDLASPDGWRALFQDAFTVDRPCRGVVYLPAMDNGPSEATTSDALDADMRRSVLDAVRLVQTLAQQDWRDAPRLWLVTRGAQAAGDDASAVSISQAPLWGLGRTIAIEHPEFGCARVDLDPAPTKDDARRLLEEILSAGGEDQIAIRRGARLVARLSRSTFEAAPERAFALRPERSYLITGGLGGLGLLVARWMVARGARHVALVGRSAPSDAAAEAIRDMEQAGAEVLVLRADVSDRAEISGALSTLGERLPQLAGIVHAAGVIDDGMLTGLAEDQAWRVLAPKVKGSHNLHALTRELPLDFFVLYSSAASLMGSPGQAHYAAANAYMDALAHHRAALGLPAMSIQWGPVSEVGLAAAQENRAQRLALRGAASLSPDEMLDVQESLLSRPRAEVGALRLSIRQWREFYPRMAGLPFLSELREEGPGVVSGAGRLRQVLEELAPSGRLAALERHVAEHLGRVLRLPADRIDARGTFQSYGIDSLMSLEVRNGLEASLGLRLSAALLFTYPTIAALAEHLLREMQLDDSPAGHAGGELDGEDASHALQVQKVKDLSDQEAAAMLEAKLLDLEGYLS